MTSNHRNQFDALADNHDHSEPHATQENTDKNRTKSGTGQRNKGKSPASGYTTPNLPPPPQAVPNQGRPNTQKTSYPNTRNRGGQHGVSRGTGRGMGRGVSFGQPTNRLDPNAVGWRTPGNSQGLFHFGSTSAPAGVSAGVDPSQSGLRPPSCSTPGESGDQTSPGATVFP